MIKRIFFHDSAARISYYLVANPGVQKGGAISIAQMCGGAKECVACMSVDVEVRRRGLDFIEDEEAQRLGFEGRRFGHFESARSAILAAGFTLGTLITAESA